LAKLFLKGVRPTHFEDTDELMYEVLWTNLKTMHKAGTQLLLGTHAM
jgi:hypothetical protein